jgi:hypothetical protein
MKSPASPAPKMSCHGLRKSVEELLAQLDRDEAREWEASWWGHRNGGVELSGPSGAVDPCRSMK